jgi:RNA polymerase sigma factor (sigma-70 family)
VLTETDVQAALSGDHAAMRLLVAELEPVIRVRVARALYRYRGKAQRRNLLQEADDLTQEVFLTLFRNEGGALRAWDPERGLSLIGFVRLVADRTVGAILTSRVRTPWRDEPVDPHHLSEVQLVESAGDERVMSKELAERVYDTLSVELTPLGFRVFEVLFVDGAEVATACQQLNMTQNSVYVWRNRLLKMIRRVTSPSLSGQEQLP